MTRQRSKLGAVQQAIIRDLADGGVHSRVELTDGRTPISVAVALDSLTRLGFVDTWGVETDRGRRVMVRITQLALETFKEPFSLERGFTVEA